MITFGDCLIPKEVMSDASLPPNAKLIYGEVKRRCNYSEDGCCVISNSELAEAFSMGNNTISKNINLLVRGGYLKSEILLGGKMAVQRKLTALV